MNIAIIGVGLIGGSIALVLKQKGFTRHVIGVDKNKQHGEKALALGLVDEVTDIKTALSKATLIILALPVNDCVEILPYLLSQIDTQIIIDTGSTKQKMIEATKDHVRRGRYVATHPMWGTEFSGPEAAIKEAFAGKAAVICNKEESDKDALALAENIYQLLGMHLIYMDGAYHDLHVAYISHISHITSFALANTVLEKEKEEDAIFELASGGFESTVRLAKSNPDMWLPIFKQNRDNVLDVLNEHIAQLKKFKSCLEKENYEYLQELMVNANKIKKVLNGKIKELQV